jgi:Uma2 family endonuclease
MIASPDHFKLSPQAYLDWEAQQLTKHEYLDGEAYAMTGGTLPHNDIAVNLTTALKTHLRGSHCKVRIADAKVGITEQGPFFYPDIVVSCDDRDRKAIKVIHFPCLIIEVLSPGTEAFDRGEKFRHYRRLETLQDYVLVSAETMLVERFHRTERGTWELTSFSPEEMASTIEEELIAEELIAEALTVSFTSVNFQCSLGLIYEDVVISPVEPA